MLLLKNGLTKTLNNKQHFICYDSVLEILKTESLKKISIGKRKKGFGFVRNLFIYPETEKKQLCFFKNC